MKTNNTVARIWTSITNILEKVVTILGVLGIVVLTVNLIVSVIFRYILNKPIYFSNELSLLLFAGVTFLGGCLGLRKNVLTRITVILNRCATKTAKVIEVFIQVMILFFSTIVLIYSVIWITDPTVLRQSPSTFDLPSWVFFIILPLTMLLMVVFSLDNIIRIVKDKREVEGND